MKCYLQLLAAPGHSLYRFFIVMSRKPLCTFSPLQIFLLRCWILYISFSWMSSHSTIIAFLPTEIFFQVFCLFSFSLPLLLQSEKGKKNKIEVGKMPELPFILNGFSNPCFFFSFAFTFSITLLFKYCILFKARHSYTTTLLQ